MCVCVCACVRVCGCVCGAGGGGEGVWCVSPKFVHYYSTPMVKGTILCHHVSGGGGGSGALPPTKNRLERVDFRQFDLYFQHIFSR